MQPVNGARERPIVRAVSLASERFDSSLRLSIHPQENDVKIQKNGRKRGFKGNGNGAHQDVSPMGHGTATKTRKGRRRAADRQRKQRGWR